MAKARKKPSKKKATKRRSKAKKNPALISVKELGYFYEDGIRDFDGSALVGQNLSGMDLRDASFRGANLFGANFEGADIRGADFTGANLGTAKMEGALVSRETNLTNVHAEGVSGAPRYEEGFWDQDTGAEKPVVEAEWEYEDGIRFNRGNGPRVTVDGKVVEVAEPTIEGMDLDEFIVHFRSTFAKAGFDISDVEILRYDQVEAQGKGEGVPFVIRGWRWGSPADDWFVTNYPFGDWYLDGLSEGLAGFVSEDDDAWHQYFRAREEVIGKQPKGRSSTSNPRKQARKQARKTPESKRMADRSLRLWDAYDDHQTKKNFMSFVAYVDGPMASSKSVKVKAARTKAKRAISKEWKLKGWVAPAAKPKAKTRAKRRRNPIHHSPRHEMEIRVLDEAGWHVILEPSSIEGPDEGSINAVKLVDPDNEDYYALITRSARDPGQWQATRFDERGPVGHATRDTLIEAVNDTRKWYGLTVSEVLEKNPTKRRAKKKVKKASPKRRKNPTSPDGIKFDAGAVTKGKLPFYRGARGGSEHGATYFISSEMMAKFYGPVSEYRIKLRNPKFVSKEEWSGFDSIMLRVDPSPVQELEDDGYDSAVWVTETPQGLMFTVFALDGESVAKRNPGIPGFRKGLSKTSRDALVVGLTVEPTPFNVKRRTMRTLVKLELAEVVDDLQGSANLELTPLGRNAATTIAENRYYDIEEGELSPALIIKMGLPQLNARKKVKKRATKRRKNPPAGSPLSLERDGGGSRWPDRRTVPFVLGTRDERKAFTKVAKEMVRLGFAIDYEYVGKHVAEGIEARGLLVIQSETMPLPLERMSEIWDSASSGHWMEIYDDAYRGPEDQNAAAEELLAMHGGTIPLSYGDVRFKNPKKRKTPKKRKAPNKRKTPKKRARRNPPAGSPLRREFDRQKEAGEHASFGPWPQMREVTFTLGTRDHRKAFTKMAKEMMRLGFAIDYNYIAEGHYGRDSQARGELYLQSESMPLPWDRMEEAWYSLFVDSDIQPRMYVIDDEYKGPEDPEDQNAAAEALLEKHGGKIPLTYGGAEISPPPAPRRVVVGDGEIANPKKRRPKKAPPKRRKNPDVRLNLTDNQMSLLWVAVSLRVESIAEDDEEYPSYTPAEVRAWDQVFAKVEKAKDESSKLEVTRDELDLLWAAVDIRSDSAYESGERAMVRAWNQILAKVNKARS